MKSRRLSPFLGLWLGALAFGQALPAAAQTAKSGASFSSPAPAVPAPRPVRWADSAPTASFTANCTGRACGFDSSGSSDDIGIVAWDWNLGDGTTTSGQNVAHVYATAGTYAVTLLGTDTGGQVTGLAVLVHVSG
jgi:PKD repeat protein